MILDSSTLLTITSFVLNVALVPMWLAYRTMRAELTKMVLVMDLVQETLKRVEQRQYDRRMVSEIVDNEQRKGVAERRNRV